MKEFVTSGPEELIEYLCRFQMPVCVFSRNLYSWFGSAIARQTKGVYNHFMWLVSPATLATQDWTWRRMALEKYMAGEHVLKFVSGPWGGYQRTALLASLRKSLADRWYRRIYDPLQIIGHRIGLKWLQIPGLSICSDRAVYIGAVDKRYRLSHPTPTELNLWMKCAPGYSVVCRFVPDDV